ncbi:MAG: efflux RND transporter periplasmic adaptor subunit [Alphaproteobacteria bacterium]|nr:efflux RND transporter periplasmic adaptor subunit [Alphaproteobacteria bacterium]
MSRLLTRLSAGAAVAGAIVIALLFGSRLFNLSGEGVSERKGNVPVVVAETVAMTVFVDSIEALGTARANESVDITAQTTDTVARISFKDGDRVEKDQILIELTSTEEDADLSSARAELAEAEKQLLRLIELARTGSASQSRLDQQRGTRDSAKGRVSAIEARLADRLIRAPFAGVLGLRNVSTGTLVKPGDVITTLDDVSIIKVDFTVPETYLSALAVGQTINAASEAYPETRFAGTVTSIDSRVDPVTRAVIVRAEIPNTEGQLKPGMLMSVELVRRSREAAAVPEGAIVPVQTQRFAFRLDADLKAERVEVRTGARKPGYVEILSGLDVGDLVVTEGTNKVRPGITVKLAPAPKPNDGVAATPKGGAT